MKKSRLISLAVAAFTAAQLVLAPANVSAADAGVQGIVVAENTSAYSSITSEQGLKEYAAAYKGTQVTDYVIDVFGKTVTASGLDYVGILCREFKAAEIDAWLAFDMNDNVESSNLTAFYQSNPQIKRVKYNSSLNTTYHSCMDYSHEAVRNYMLNVIKQALDKYDCDGIELDFQNAIWMWAVGGEYNGLDILDAFMRKVDRLVKTYEVKYKHEIKISVRCAADLETNYELGIDVATWVADGILDRVVPTSAGNITDFDVPVRVWTALMHPYGGEVVPSIQAKYAAHEGIKAEQYSNQTAETLQGAAANWLSQGADKVYLNGLKGNSAYTNALNTVGSHKTLMNTVRKNVLTYNNVNPFWSKSNPQIPSAGKSISKDTTGTIRIPMGDILDGATVTLNFIGSSITGTPFVYTNSKQANFVKAATSAASEYAAYMKTGYSFYSYTVPAEVFHESYLVVEITPPAPLTINYAEVIVTPAK